MAASTTNASIAGTLPGLHPFRARAPWLGPDLQTLHNNLWAGSPDPGAFTRLWLDLPDGDALAAALHEPAPGTPARPLMVLVHGLTGCEGSHYVRRSTCFWLARGFPVLRLNLRGSAPSRPRSRGSYHAGRSEDLRDALLSLPPPWRARPLCLVGVSLGGTMLLNFLGREGGEATPGIELAVAATLCAPVDLMAAARRIAAPRNLPYHRWLLANMKREAQALGGHVPPTLLAKALAAGSLYDFDDTYVAPLHGFADAPDYYARCSLAPHLAMIRTPTLCLTSADDPWVPAASYRAQDWAANPRVTPVIAVGGGHVGFHDRPARAGADAGTWADRAIAAYFTGAGIG
ncbi:MAG: alpha/beta fold hydrolase [Alphaproteobacteria bacterium]|nr:alpha/beta fold hydrolase [Alphaproteobacteria bacterium]